jgi:hypothetical protein
VARGWPERARARQNLDKEHSEADMLGPCDRERERGRDKGEWATDRWAAQAMQVNGPAGDMGRVCGSGPFIKRKKIQKFA